MNLKNEIKENNSVLLVIPSEYYNDVLMKTVKQIADEKICYITINKGYSALTLLLKKNKVNLNNFFFIDSITKTVKAIKDAKDCKYVTSPNALSELGITISKSVQNYKPKFILLDSLSTLLIYHNDNIVTKFAQGLINKFETTESKLIFTITTKDKTTNLFKNLQMFINKVVDL